MRVRLRDMTQKASWSLIIIIINVYKQVSHSAVHTLYILISPGPVVWFQQFEYAVGHWFQKATEHVFGCVLCSPGCFSLFRASALMDDNVMRQYCELAEAPREVVQFDQGTKSHYHSIIVP